MYSESDGVGFPTSGFPIRNSTDQSFCAAPRGLSQLITSFICGFRQGIHYALLLYLTTSPDLPYHEKTGQRSTASKFAVYFITHLLANMSELLWTLFNFAVIANPGSEPEKITMNDIYTF